MSTEIPTALLDHVEQAGLEALARGLEDDITPLASFCMADGRTQGMVVDFHKEGNAIIATFDGDFASMELTLTLKENAVAPHPSAH